MSEHTSTAVAPQHTLDHMVWVPGGTFLMGSDAFYPEERPAHPATVGGFWIDAYPVTVAAFARFVADTGYRTVAEQPLDPALYPGADPALLVPGSLVFQQPTHRLLPHDYRDWWAYVPGASWRRPLGHGSTVAGLESHPVTHVAHADAEAYAAWAGKALPTEAEWERAARGGLDGKIFVWGDEFMPDGRSMANTWQGEFPWQNVLTDGYARTSPVGSFPANGYGLYDMAGNVWEWTADAATPHHRQAAAAPCCAPRTPRGETTVPAPLPLPGATAIPQKVIKGGSHLCAPNYCLRYRPAARQSESVDTSTSHLGFRCIIRPPATT